MTKKIAIIGAGISGVAAAKELADIAEVSVFEKSRGLGGRMATRRAGDYSFDHAAQFFTARSNEFKELIDTSGDEAAQVWNPRTITYERAHKPYKREWFEDHFVGLPGMNGMLKVMAKDIDIHLATRISHIDKHAECWRLYDDQQHSLGNFDWVISTAPAPQTLDVLPDSFHHRALMKQVEFLPCYALMLGFKIAPALNFDAAVIKNEAISWVSVNSSKPGRPEAYSLIAHSDNCWAKANLEADQESVVSQLMTCLAEILGIETDHADHIALHRWRYARVEKSVAMDFLLDEQSRLAACGDWCRGNRVEDAFLSGQRLGQDLRQRLLD